MRSRNRTGKFSLLLAALPILVATAITGCAGLAERVATRVVDHDLKLEHDLQVVGGDLALYRQCFGERGGQCVGSSASALPSSTNEAAGATVGSCRPGTSERLARSVAQLGPGHPAAAAYAVLKHPMVRKASALHDHLRGVTSPTPVPGVTIAQDGAGQSTVHLDLPLDQVTGFHDDLIASATAGGWQALHEHCVGQLASGAASGSDAVGLARDCRTVAFVRAYLAAYFHQGRFVEVKVDLAGLLAAITADSKAVSDQIQQLETRLQRVQNLAQTATGFRQLESDVQSLDTGIQSASSSLERLAARVGDDLGEVLEREVDMSSKLARPVRTLTGASQQQAVAPVVAGLGKEIAFLAARLQEIQDKIQALSQEAIDKVDTELQKADTALSNVFKVSQAGFVSRDTTFQAQLPTFQITFDPTATRLFSIEDLATQQQITRTSDLGRLGVATDTSGVGTTSSLIGTELVRVFLEAVFDAHEGLPAVAPINLGLTGAGATAPTGLSVEPAEYRLPAFQSPMGNVDAADLSAMTEANSRAAAGVRAALQRAIGGIGPFSLNNQAVEDFIVEIVATTVRKVAEKATWCWYACDLDSAVAAAQREAENALRTEEKKVETGIETKAKTAEEKAEAGLRREAERVRLKLTIAS